MSSSVQRAGDPALESGEAHDKEKRKVESKGEFPLRSFITRRSVEE